MKAIKSRNSFSKPQLLIFLIVFSLIGFLIYKSFAAPNPSLPGDLNSDNTVNITDMSILLSNYNTTNTAADINSDGTVNVLDLSILLSHYGQSLSAKPSIPTGLTATPGDSQVTLHWNANPASDNVDVYQVYYQPTCAWNGPETELLSITGTTYTAINLTNGTTYCFRVGAHNSAGYGPWNDPPVPATPSGTTGGGGTAPGSWLAASSPFNTLIPGNPSVTFNYNTGPLASVGGINLNSYTWGVAIFDQLSNLPTTNLTQVSWACGVNPCWKIDNVPVPPQLYTYETTQLSLNDGERHASILYGDKIYNLYEMSQDSSGWHFAAGGVLRAGGSGVWNNNLGPWVGRASGFADYDGTVRKAEVDAGVINHALTASWPKDHIAKSSISPAATSDGSCTSNCAPMGSRLQLDPNLTTQDFTNMGFTSYWWPILVAMQKYGVYIADSSNAMALFAEDWNNNGRVVWPSKTAWDNNSSKLLAHFRIVQAPPSPVLDDRTIFGQPHQ